MLGKRLINTTVAGESCTTDTLDLAGIPAGSCVAYYKLDSTAADVTGNYDGTATNVTYTNSGQFSQAADFKALQGYIVTPVGVYSNSFGGHSVSFWMKSGGTNYETPIYTRTSSAAAGWHIRTSIGGNGINWAWQNSSGGVVFASGEEAVTLTDGWHHVVAIWDGTTNANGAKLYIDGVLFDELTANATLASQSFSLGITLGADRQSSGRSILGLDQVRIYNQALSQANVDTLYNEVQCPCTTDTVDYPTTNAAYYQLDNNPQDSTTNGYDGVASNVTYSTGKFGQAASFNGTSSKIELPNNAFKFTTFTANYWFNANNVAGTFQTIYSAYDNDGTNGGVTCGISGGKLWLFGAGGSTSPTHYYGTTTISNGVWYLATLIVDGTSIKMYLNNVLDINLTFGSNLAYRPTHQFTVGARDVGVNTYGYYNGLVDQFRIFDTALTAAQVTDLYDEVYCVPPPLDFNTVLYTGDNSTPQTVTGMSFQPDMVWQKQRTGTASHRIVDSIRGSGNYLYSNLTNANDGYNADYMRLAYDGVYLPGADSNYATNDYVVWGWKAGGNTSTYNIDDVGYATAIAAGLDSGTINPTGASVNTAKGFSIVKWTGANTNSTSVAHGLDAAPEMVILRHTNVAGDWRVYHDGIPDDSFLYLNQNSALVDINVNKNYTATTISQQWTAGSYDWIAYCWHSVAGHSKIGSYTGTGQPNNFVSTSVNGDAGFKPRWVMIKSTASQDWNIVDSARNPSNPANLVLQANSSGAESSSANPAIQVDFDDTGFSLVAPAGTPGEGQVNSSGSTYIYMAFA